MSIGIIIIGDEIFLGCWQDKYLVKVIELFGVCGFVFDWVEYVGDDLVCIIVMFVCVIVLGDIVFLMGGIGVMLDDYMCQCVVVVFGVLFVLYLEVKELILEWICEMYIDLVMLVDFELLENQYCFNMGVFLVGVMIILNGYNWIFGFLVGDFYFVLGFLVMVWLMIEWVFDMKYVYLYYVMLYVECLLYVFELLELIFMLLMEKIECDFLGVCVFSLLSVGDVECGGIYVCWYIDFGVKGELEVVVVVFVKLCEGVYLFGGDVVEFDMLCF